MRFMLLHYEWIIINVTAVENRRMMIDKVIQSYPEGSNQSDRGLLEIKLHLPSMNLLPPCSFLKSSYSDVSQSTSHE